jgi:hypothetical protein
VGEVGMGVGRGAGVGGVTSPKGIGKGLVTMTTADAGFFFWLFNRFMSIAIGWEKGCEKGLGNDWWRLGHGPTTMR